MQVWVVSLFMAHLLGGEGIERSAVREFSQGRLEQAAWLLDLMGDRRRLRREKWSTWHEERVRVSYLGGRIALLRGKPTEAVAWLEKIARQPSPIRDLVAYHLGLAYRQSGQAKKAVETFTWIKKEFGGRWRQPIRKQLLLALSEAKAWGELEKLWQKLLWYPQPYGGKQRVWWGLLQAQLDGSKVEEATKGLRRFALSYPGSVLARQAWDKLRHLEKERKITVNPLSVDEQHFQLWHKAYLQPNQALQAIPKWWGQLSASQKANHYLLNSRLMIQGRALWYSDQREKAIELFRKVASDKRAPDGLRRDVVKRLGQIYRDVGRYEEGEKFLHAYAEAEPDRRLGAWASYQAAWMAMYQENYRRAIRLFKEYLKVYPDVPKRQIWRVRWYQAWCLFQLGSYREAIVQFRQLKRRVHRAQDGRRCEYWEARAYERMGDWGQAQRIYAGLARKSQMSYYGILAQQRLYLLGVQIAQQRCDGSCLAQSLRTKADQWLDSGFGKSRNHQFAGVSAEWRELIEKSFAHNSSNQTNDQEMEATALKATQYAVQPVQFPPLPSACKSSKWSACKALRRAQFLAVLGFERDAIDELYRGRYALRRSTAHLLAAIRWLRSKNAHHEAVQLSFYLRGTDSKMGLFYRDLLELSYPPAFAELVLRYAREFGISPALVWAVMREESLYAPFARSRVGALGLMQIIYPTGKRIAQQLKVDNFRFKSLYEIPVSIRKGSWYLAQLVRKYDGHILLAAAAYNAGPHRITVWLKNRNHLDLDAFIEEIYFEETRNYVKRIFRSYTAYSFLYRRRLPSTPPAVAVTVQNNIDF